MIFRRVWKLFLSPEKYEKKMAREEEIRAVERSKRGPAQALAMAQNLWFTKDDMSVEYPSLGESL